MDCNDSEGICVAKKINNTLFKGFQTHNVLEEVFFRIQEKLGGRLGHGLGEKQL
jgi:hypothetical protein